MSKRERLYPEIVRLHDEDGLVFREIGERLGLATSTVSDYYGDPTGERARARKAKTNGTCVDCGAETISDGSYVPERCPPCGARANGKARKVWTREAIIAAIQDWAVEHGGIYPSLRAWNPTHARNLGGEPHPDYLADPLRWPCSHTVLREFGGAGGWRRAVIAAGFTPREQGPTIKYMQRAAA